MGSIGGGLKTIHSEDILSYLKVYAECEKKWWSLALEKKESASKFNGYCGKRRVLDSFFARVKKEALAQTGMEKVCVAYGNPNLSNGTKGKGEVAAPMTDTYKSCKRIFEDVKPMDEYRTTAVSWESATYKETVYRKIDENGVGSLHHVAKGHKIPFVPDDERARVRAYLEKTKVKNRHRKGGLIQPEKPDDGKKIRYPEVRGLRYSKVDCMFKDRDGESGACLARLRCMELMGRQRPYPFNRRNRAPL